MSMDMNEYIYKCYVNNYDEFDKWVRSVLNGHINKHSRHNVFVLECTHNYAHGTGYLVIGIQG